MALAARRNLLRDRDGGHARVGFVELFFDLVFVFAVTQLSHRLISHFTPVGAFETLLLLLGIWWVWIYTTWFTNRLDVETMPVRWVLFALMAAGLFLSMTIPDAFGERGLIFACAYAGMQVGRSLFTLWALHRHDRDLFEHFVRITGWLGASAAFWIAGGLSDPGMRLALWGMALAIEYAGPSVHFHIPGLGRSKPEDWDIESHHMAERCGLFVIIALGESILVTGATFAGEAWTPTSTAAFASAFVTTLAMWWIYFNIGAHRASDKVEDEADSGALARLAYNYLHVPIVAGIIVVAASDELVLEHPTGHTGWGTAAAILGGPALYLLGNLLFKRATGAQYLPLSHMAGIALLCGLGAAVPLLPPLWLSLLSTAVMVLVAGWETWSLRAPAEGELHRPKVAQGSDAADHVPDRDGKPARG